jgi:DNA-binding PadR family transcriptional regulator
LIVNDIYRLSDILFYEYIVRNIYLMTDTFINLKHQMHQIMKLDGKNADEIEDCLHLKGFLSFLLLHELNLNSLCGDELSKKIGKRKGSNLTPGTIYPALKRLRRRKLISYRRDGRKKMYLLTEDDKKEVERLYFLFGNYFYGLKNKLPRVPLEKPSAVKIGAVKKQRK